ncbi:N-6 DNA methylase, partial [Nostoc sp. CHAB 5844]|nr:N-6 DNA methylase [Nostoc sp. CHAB 5844]
LYVEFTVKAAKQGATLAIVLDNKWFHNENTRNIRSILLKYCRILAIVTYPHSRYFEGIMIATSMLVVEKVAASPADQVTFARVEDPGVASAEIAAAVIRGAEAPSGWSTRRVPQAELTSDSWKKYLSTDLIHEYRRLPLRSLPELFASGRRGSLAKEGGGIAVYEFPYRTQYGPRRSRLDNGNPFQTVSGEALTQNQNASLKALAASIPDEYRGYAINKADRIFGYELGLADVTRDWTIEGPEQRHQNFAQRYQSNRRARWTNDMNALVDNLRAAPATGLYVHAIEEHVGLDETVLPREQLWNVLREPYAGGLVVPRKQRSGHRVHVNPFAFEEGQRQIRLSSNFLSYGNCVCVDDANGLTAPIATRLVAAWLVSSFGHLQFELEANNREGARSIEQHHMDRIFVFDPRLIRHDHRDKILSAFRDLPFPIRTDLRVELQPLLVAMDKLFAAELAHVFPDFDPAAALTEVWSRLHEAHQARNA